MNIFDDYKFWWKVFLHNIHKKHNGFELDVDGAIYTMTFRNGPRSSGRYEVEYHVPGLFKVAFMFSFNDDNFSCDEPSSWQSHYLRFFGDQVDLDQYLLLLRLMVD